MQRVTRLTRRPRPCSDRHPRRSPTPEGPSDDPLCPHRPPTLRSCQQHDRQRIPPLRSGEAEFVEVRVVSDRVSAAGWVVSRARDGVVRESASAAGGGFCQGFLTFAACRTLFGWIRGLTFILGSPWLLAGSRRNPKQTTQTRKQSAQEPTRSKHPASNPPD